MIACSRVSRKNGSVCKGSYIHVSVEQTDLPPGMRQRFISGLQTGHPMASISSASNKLCVLRAAWGVLCPSPGGEILYNMLMSYCWLTVPYTTTSSKVPTTWKTPPFHEANDGVCIPYISFCKNPLNFKQRTDELRHGYQNVGGWTWLISKY